MYKVVHEFKDLEDNNFIYGQGDTYPRAEKSIEEISKERIKALSTKKNKIGKVLIEEIKDDKSANNKTTTEE